MQHWRVVNNSAAVLALELTTKLLPLVTFPWVVRALGPSGYGKVGFALAVSGMFGLLAAPGFYSYGIREVARKPERSNEIAQELVGARITFAACSYLALVAFTFTLAPHDSATRVLLLLSGLSFLVAPLDLRWLFVGMSRMWGMALAGIAGQLAYAALLLGFVRGPADGWIIPSAATVAALISAFLMLRRAVRQFHISWPAFAPERWAAFLPICLTLGLASMMSLVYDQIDTIMLRYLRTEQEVGIYVASYRLMTISMSFLPVLGQVFFPLLSGSTKDAKSEKTHMQWLGNATVALALPIATGGFLLAGPITYFLLGAKYNGAEVLVRWLMLNLITAPMASFLSSRLVTHRRERKYLASVGIGAAFNVILNLIFIPQFGAIAAVWTTIVSQAMVGLAGLHFSRDLVWPNLWRPFAVASLASGIMAIGIVGLRRVGHVHVIVMIAAGAALYGAVYVLSHFLWGRLQPRAA